MITSTLNAIPNQFSLSENQQNAHSNYLAYFNVLNSLSTEHRSVLEMYPEEISAIQNLANTSLEPLAGYSRNILIANQLLNYREPILLPDMTKSGIDKPETFTGHINSETYFRIYPNPAGDYIILEYSNPIPSGNIIFVITNLEGKELRKIQVSKQQDQFVVKTDEFGSGTYLCTMYCGNNKLQSQKFIVIQ